ncbi:unnamed protein product [Calypogeia fissa]
MAGKLRSRDPRMAKDGGGRAPADGSGNVAPDCASTTSPLKMGVSVRRGGTFCLTIYMTEMHVTGTLQPGRPTALYDLTPMALHGLAWPCSSDEWSGMDMESRFCIRVTKSGGY